MRIALPRFCRAKLLALAGVIPGNHWLVSLVTVPRLLVTTTVNTALLSPMLVAGVVYMLEVAPLMSVSFFFHW